MTLDPLLLDVLPHHVALDLCAGALLTMLLLFLSNFVVAVLILVLRMFLSIS